MEKKVIGISAIGLDDRGLKVLRFFITRFCANRCEIAGKEEQATAFIINMDSINSEKELRRIKESFPKNPIIHMAISTIECSPHYFIRKPLIVEHFLSVLSEIENLPNHQLTVDQIVSIHEEDNKFVTTSDGKMYERRDEARVERRNKPRTVASKIASENNKVGIAGFAGNKKDIDLTDYSDDESIYFNPEDYYLFYVQQAVAQAKKENKVVRLTGLWQTITICPKYNLVHMTKSDKKLRSFCLAVLDNSHKDSLLIDETAFSCESVEDFEAKLLFNGASAEHIHDLDQFLWKMSLWTARGRLPEGTDLNQVFQVKAWPNFTRLMLSPHAFNLTAYWAAKPRTLLETVQGLGFEQRYIFSLYSAMTVLGNIHARDTENIEIEEDEDFHVPDITPKIHNLFSRVINRLRA